MEKLATAVEEMIQVKRSIAALMENANQKRYDGPKLPASLKEDEPLSFDKLKQEMAPDGSYGGFAYALQSAPTLQVLENIGMQIKKSTLSGVEKLRLHNLGQQIANDKFNF